jgi:primosomal replication protein N
MVSVSDDLLEDDVPKRLEVELRSINAPAILIERDQQRRIAADKTCRRVRLKVERPAAASHRIRKRSPCRRLVASCALGYIRDQDKHEPGLASQSLCKLPFQGTGFHCATKLTKGLSVFVLGNIHGQPSRRGSASMILTAVAMIVPPPEPNASTTGSRSTVIGASHRPTNNFRGDERLANVQRWSL